MFLLFDIGGTHIRVAVPRDGREVGEYETASTPQRFEDGIQELKKLILKVGKKTTIKAAVGGVAGPLDRERTMLVRSPNLPEWDSHPLRERVTEITGAEHVFLENDTALVGLGEATQGAGRGARIVAYLTVSTGIGGVRIVDGKIDTNAMGFEPGWHIVDWQGREAFPGCGARGYLEEYIGGNTLEQCTGKKVQEISDEKVWGRVEELIAVYLNNTLMFWSPDVIVLGGGVIAKSRYISVKRIEKRFRELATVLFPNPPSVKKAALGDTGGLQGALVYLKQQITMNSHGKKS